MDQHTDQPETDPDGSATGHTITMATNRRYPVPDLLLLFALALIVCWGSCVTFDRWNDPGYHAHMAQLLTEHGILPAHDPHWRGGILVNYPMLWPVCLSVAAAISGAEIWDVYPYALVVVWALLPCAIFFLIHALTQRRDWAWAAGALALYPFPVPDQAAMLCALVLTPPTIVMYLRLLRPRPRIRTTLVFGALVGLIFHSNLLVFHFLITTFALTMLFHLPLVHLDPQAADRRERVQRLKTVAGHLIVSVLVFFVMTAHWWWVSYKAYQSHLLETPLSTLTRDADMLAKIIWPMYFAFVGNLVLGASLCAVPAAIAWQRQAFQDAIRGYRTEVLYLVVFIIAAIVFYCPTPAFGMLGSAPWRYFVFLHLAMIVMAGIAVPSLITKMSAVVCSSAGAANRLRIICTIIFVAGAASYSLLKVRTWIESGRLQHGQIVSYPFPHPEDHRHAMAAIDEMVAEGDVIAAKTAHSTRLLYFTRAATLGGHYGGFNPDTSRDIALNTILYSDDLDATVAMIRKYRVRYIYVDALNPAGSAFEDSVAAYKNYGTYNLNKLMGLFKAVINENGILVFDTSWPALRTAPEETDRWLVALLDGTGTDTSVRSTPYTESFNRTDVWPMNAVNVPEGEWRVTSQPGTMIIHQHVGADQGIREVYATHTFDADSTITVMPQHYPVLRVRYRVSDPDARLHLAFKVGDVVADQMFASTEWAEAHVLLSIYDSGPLEYIHWGVWTDGNSIDDQWVEIDEITILSGDIFHRQPTHREDRE